MREIGRKSQYITSCWRLIYGVYNEKTNSKTEVERERERKGKTGIQPRRSRVTSDTSICLPLYSLLPAFAFRGIYTREEEEEEAEYSREVIHTREYTRPPRGNQILISGKSH